MELKIERTYPASPDELWELWTTPGGIEQWWAPDGFVVEVCELELRPGGELEYAMIAIGPEQVDFMEQAGLPLRTEARKTFTDVEPGKRLGYRSLVDYVPDVEPYEQETLVEFQPADGETRVIMTMEAMHDEEWTQRLVTGRANELDNLARYFVP